MLAVTPERVLAVLHKAGIRGVLMGTHGLNDYRDEARATQHVDVLAAKRQLRRAIHCLSESFPQLEISENSSVARFIDPVTQKAVIDILKPSSQVMQAAFRNSVAVAESHRIPSLEMALVAKFVAMLAPNRRADKRLLDAGDFTNIVMHNRASLDLRKLERLANRVYTEGGKKILRKIADIDAGKTIDPK